MSMSNGSHTLSIALFATLFGSASVANADAVEDFYRGKQVRIVVGYDAGGGYDMMSRLVARHIKRFIPGNPNITVANMPGASSLVAAKHVINAAPKDGSVIGNLSGSLPFNQVFDSSKRGAGADASASVDLTQLHWIGSPIHSNKLLVIWHAAGIKSLDDAKKKVVNLAVTGAESREALYLHVLNNMLGTKFRLIAGYPGGANTDLAIERGEVDGRGAVTYASLKATRPQWLSEGLVNIILQEGFAPEADLKDVPLLVDLARTPVERSILEILASGTRIGQPFAVPRQIPEERLDALRAAFEATTRDSRFLSDAESSGIELAPVSGEAIESLVDSMVSAPKAVTELLHELTQKKN